jgi:hypothetical protein
MAQLSKGPAGLARHRDHSFRTSIAIEVSSRERFVSEVTTRRKAMG